MKTSRFILWATGLALAITACSKEGREATYDAQETFIGTFVTNMLKDTTCYATYLDGPVRVTVAEGTGDPVASDGTVSFYYAAYTMASASSIDLFWTNNADEAKALAWSVTDSTVFSLKTIRLNEGDLVPGLRTGLAGTSGAEGVRGGEECWIVFSGRYGFGNRTVGTVSANSALAYHVWVHSISNE